LFTVWLNAGDVLGPLYLSPWYAAVMEFEPVDSDKVMISATPP